MEEKRSKKIDDVKKETVTALDTLQSQEMIDHSSVDHNFGEEMKYDTDFKASATKPRTGSREFSQWVDAN